MNRTNSWGNKANKRSKKDGGWGRPWKNHVENILREIPKDVTNKKQTTLNAESINVKIKTVNKLIRISTDEEQISEQ